MGKTYKSEKETIKDDETILREANKYLNGIESYESIRKHYYLRKEHGKQCPTYRAISEMYDLYHNDTLVLPLNDYYVDVKLKPNKSLTSISEINAANRLVAAAHIVHSLKKDSYSDFYFNGLNDVLRKSILDGKTSIKLTNEHYFSMNVATIVTIIGILLTWITLHVTFGAFITTIFLIAENIGSIMVLYYVIIYNEKLI